MRQYRMIGAAAIAASLAAASFAAPASAATRHHHYRHHVMHSPAAHHRAMDRHVLRATPRYVRGAPAMYRAAPGYGYGYGPRYYDNGFNPIAGVLGAATTIATSPLAIATGGYPYESGYWGAPYGYRYGYGYNRDYNDGMGWPGNGPYYNVW
ncbi:MAG: hypothetical protein KGM42_06185 [Hyphomicrobiales bacterium]|nr:hypothetical protein [Hyphomicrobiales bacterium]